jgi:hypothetical protein
MRFNVSSLFFALKGGHEFFLRPLLYLDQRSSQVRYEIAILDRGMEPARQ